MDAWLDLRPDGPRNVHWVMARRDGDDARVPVEALKRFLKGWRETGVDRRRIKCV